MNGQVRQDVTAVNGFGYGVVGADLHLFGTGVPVYLLLAWADAQPPPTTWLRELPSRMLNAKYAVVDFTGRTAELDDLRRWRTDPARLAVRWLHGPGGQGKTRLANEAAADAVADGWLVVRAMHGLGPVHPPPGSQDLTGDGAAGILLVVDYADRWPVSHLIWLLSNALLHRPDTPTRVLFVARTDDGWPAVRVALEPLRPNVSTHRLDPIDTADRVAVFTHARDCFARRYALPDLPATPLSAMDTPDMGLTLAIHMSALVAVDAHARGEPAPADLPALTLYLLDRENLHWASRVADSGHVIGGPATQPYRNPRATMNKAVFVASLTGVLARETGLDVLARTVSGADPALIADDHAVCYPAETPGTVLEPLYPDRLAEDFLALTLPGHSADYPTQPWATTVAAELLRRQDDGTAPPWLPRAVATLAAATSRWPHVGAGHLYPILHEDPQLAVDAGGAALTTLAAANTVDVDLLDAIEPQLPRERHVDLDGAAVTIVGKLTDLRLAATTDHKEHADLHEYFGYRLSAVGQREDALAEMSTAVDLHRKGAGDTPSPDLAHALTNLCYTLADVGRRADALAAVDESVGLYRELARTEPDEYEPDLAYALSSRALMLSFLGRYEDAFSANTETIALYRRLSAAAPDAHRHELAGALGNSAQWLSYLGRHTTALPIAEEATEIFRALAETDPNRFLPDLAAALANHGIPLHGMGRNADAVVIQQESVALFGQLSETRPDAFEHHYATALTNLSSSLLYLGMPAEGIELGRQAVRIRRAEVRRRPGVFEGELATALNNLSADLLALDEPADAFQAADEAVRIRRKLTETDPDVYEIFLASALSNAGAALLKLGQPDDALSYADEAVGRYEAIATRRPEAAQPKLAEALNNLVGIHLAREDITAAEAAIELLSGLPAADVDSLQARVRAAAQNDRRLSE